MLETWPGDFVDQNNLVSEASLRDVVGKGPRKLCDVRLLLEFADDVKSNLHCPPTLKMVLILITLMLHLSSTIIAGGPSLTSVCMSPSRVTHKIYQR